MWGWRQQNFSGRIAFSRNVLHFFDYDNLKLLWVVVHRVPPESGVLLLWSEACSGGEWSRRGEEGGERRRGEEERCGSRAMLNLQQQVRREGGEEEEGVVERGGQQ